METVLITGVGLISTSLGKKLEERGYQVKYLTRSKKNDAKKQYFQWNYNEAYIENGALEGIDHVIHLAGANIGATRWTTKRKTEIIESRTNTSALLLDKIKSGKIPIQSYISASAVGYYGAITGQKILNETDLPSQDFLGETCRLWEKSTEKFHDLGIRTVILRTGVVLTPAGGALEKIADPIKNGIGAALGSGNQYIPWIHINDLCNLYISAIENDQMNGAYNAVSDDFVTNRELTNKIGRIVKKKIWMPNIPGFILKIALGQMSDLVLYGSKISNKKLINTGFKFDYPTIDKALVSLIRANDNP